MGFLDSRRLAVQAIASSAGAAAGIDLLTGETVVGEITADSSFSGKLQAKFAPDGTYRDVPYHYSDGGIWQEASAGENVTLTAGDLVMLQVPGATDMQLLRNAGSCSVRFSATPIALEKALASVGGILPELRIVEITPTLDANAHSAGDVLFDRTAMPNAVRGVDEMGYLVDLVLLSKDDLTAADLTLVLLSANVAYGTINGVPAISDTDAENILATIVVPSSAWVDHGGCKTASVPKSLLPQAVKPASGTRTVYIAGVTAGTPTPTASGLRIRATYQDGRQAA
jgi:hypothetical protein